MAAEIGTPECMVALLMQGADVHALTAKGATPAGVVYGTSILCLKMKRTVLGLLLAAGASAGHRLHFLFASAESSNV